MDRRVPGPQHAALLPTCRVPADTSYPGAMPCPVFSSLLLNRARVTVLQAPPWGPLNPLWWPRAAAVAPGVQLPHWLRGASAHHTATQHSHKAAPTASPSTPLRPPMPLLLPTLVLQGGQNLPAPLPWTSAPHRLLGHLPSHEALDRKASEHQLQRGSVCWGLGAFCWEGRKGEIKQWNWREGCPGRQLSSTGGTHSPGTDERGTDRP